MLAVTVTNLQHLLPVDAVLVRKAVRTILHDHGVRRGSVNVAVVDDATIRRLNRQHLNKDEPTDVLSFPLEQTEGRLEAEVVVSAETAAAVAPQYGWPAACELMLYVIHGTLHLVGCDDHQPAARRRMKRLEQQYLARLGLPAEPEEEQP